MHHKPWGMNHCHPTKKVVYPTKYCVNNNFTYEEVDHIHPTHTTVVNHHHVENKHFFPYSNSVVNTGSESSVAFPPYPAPAPVTPPVTGPMPGLVPNVNTAGPAPFPGAPGMGTPFRKK
ncbi:CotD family spore coat protein [Bacillaceae bacterium S4-13-56]